MCLRYNHRLLCFFDDVLGKDGNNSSEKPAVKEIAVEGSIVTVAIPARHEAKESNSHPSRLRSCFWLQHHHASLGP